MICADEDTFMVECDCDSASVNWRHNEVRFDEHQAVVPGTCGDCGREVEYVYNEAGIRDADTADYVREF